MDLRIKVMLALSLIAITASIALLQAQNHNPSRVSEKSHLMFRTWLQRHKKSYTTPEELDYRLSVFSKNLEQVKKEQNEATLHKVGLNQFMDLTLEEYNAAYATYPSMLSAISKSVTKVEKSEKYEKLVTDFDARLSLARAQLTAQTSVDWRKNGSVSPVINQKTCSASWASSVVASAESAYWYTHQDRLTPLSIQQLIDCVPPPNGCQGGFAYPGFVYIAKNGLQASSSYPFTARQQPCNFSQKKVILTVGGSKALNQNSGATLQAGVATTVVSVTLDAGFRFYQSGVYNGTCGNGAGARVGGAVVGFGVDGASTGYWIVKMSYGVGWGESGYIRIFRQTANGGGTGRGVCGILTNPIVALA